MATSTDLIGLLDIYPKDKIVQGSKWPFLITFGLSISAYAIKLDSEKFISNIVDTSISVLPNLLGFLLGGYTILIGFGDSKLLKSTTRLVEGRSISLFQMLSSVFALTIFLQSVTLSIALLFHFTLLMPVEKKGELSLFYDYVPVINWIFIVPLLFLLFYSVFSLKDMVINVFGFAQKYHLGLLQERMQEDLDSRNSNRNQS